jgi:hypothetical protein
MAENKFNFTKASIDALPLPEAGKRGEWWDAKMPGLLVRVASAGSKSFYTLCRHKLNFLNALTHPFQGVKINRLIIKEKFCSNA